VFFPHEASVLAWLEHHQSPFPPQHANVPAPTLHCTAQSRKAGSAACISHVCTYLTHVERAHTTQNTHTKRPTHTGLTHSRAGNALPTHASGLAYKCTDRNWWCCYDCCLPRLFYTTKNIAHSTDTSVTGGTHFALVCQPGLLHAGRPKEGAHGWLCTYL